MKYIKLENGSIVSTNYTIRDLRAANPNTSFRASLDEIPSETLAEYGVFAVQPVTRPDYDLMTQTVAEVDPVLLDGVWVQTWTVSDLSAEEIAENLQAKREGMRLTPFQARAVLAQSGMLASVEALMANPDTPDIIKIAWEYASEFKRLSPSILGMSAALGLTDTQLDAMFDAGSQIEV